MGGGAWPFLVGGAICLVNSDNERDSSLLNRRRIFTVQFCCAFNWAGMIVLDQAVSVAGATRRPARSQSVARFASVASLLRGTSGVQPRDSEQ